MTYADYSGLMGKRVRGTALVPRDASEAATFDPVVVVGLVVGVEAYEDRTLLLMADEDSARLLYIVVGNDPGEDVRVEL